MKNIYVALGLIFAMEAKAQIVTTALDTNSTLAYVEDNGTFFNFGTSGGYFAPKNDSASLIYSAALWFAGMDASGQLKMAAPDIFSATQDLWPGPLTLDLAEPVASGAWPTTAWTVTKKDIVDHLLNFQNPGYVTPANLATWPAHGDLSLGFDYYLAPFVDSDLNGNYDPMSGDYPCIKGDKAVFMILNDKTNLHGSGAEPIGLELHYMFYQYDEMGDLGNTTFMDVKLINRSSQTLSNFRTSFALDGDIGNSHDDYFGCDSTRNLQYYYNDVMDEAGAGSPGFGANPPSVGVVCLSDDIFSAVSLQDYLTGIPNSPFGKYNVMNGLTGSGSVISVPFGGPTKFEYFSDPNDTLGWSEVSIYNGPGERKTIMSVDLDVLTPAMEKTITFAIVNNRSGSTNLENVTGLFQTTDAIQAFYDGSTDGNCNHSILALEEVKFKSANVFVYPNPAHDQLKIKVDGADKFQFSISDAAGRIFQHGHSTTSETEVSLKAPIGIYFLNIVTENQVFTERVVIE